MSCGSGCTHKVAQVYLASSVNRSPYAKSGAESPVLQQNKSVRLSLLLCHKDAVNSYKL